MSLVVAHLMRSNRIPLVEAFEIVRNARKIACPNEGFKFQLALYEVLVSCINIYFLIFSSLFFSYFFYVNA